MSKIFFIHPLRGTAFEYQQAIMDQVEHLESQGHEVYVPMRDTDQNDRSGLRICKDNREAIEQADVVYFAWDGESQGCLFDLGMAFALMKPVHAVIGYVPAAIAKKSFQNMVFDWEENGAE